MYTYIKKLQKKSDSEKRTILVVLMVFSFIAVGGLWALSLDRRFDSPEVFVGKNDTEEATERSRMSIAGPFASLSQTLGGGYASIKEQLENIKGGLFSQSGENAEEVPAWPLPVESQ